MDALFWGVLAVRAAVRRAARWLFFFAGALLGAELAPAALRGGAAACLLGPAGPGRCALGRAAAAASLAVSLVGGPVPLRDLRGAWDLRIAGAVVTLAADPAEPGAAWLSMAGPHLVRFRGTAGYDDFLAAMRRRGVV